MRLADWIFRFSPTFHRQQAAIERLTDQLRHALVTAAKAEVREQTVREDLVEALQQMGKMVRDGFRTPYSGRKEMPTAAPEPIGEGEQEIRNAIARRVSLNSELGRTLLADAKKRLTAGDESAEEIAGSILDGANLDEPGLDLDEEEPLDDEELEPTPSLSETSP